MEEIMSRPLRIEYPGALYHVMNRGNQRQDVFQRKIDCETFLEKLEYFAELFHVEVYCYCLMTNHFHLLLKTNEANLGRFMQSFLTSFTITLNRRNNKSGHLFQGRYKAHLVENQKYISELSRYVHLNPIRIKQHEHASIETKKNILINYQWSSFPDYLGLREHPEFLKTTVVLSTWGKQLPEKIKNYRQYVEGGLYENVNNPLELAQRQQIIGSESFAEKILREKILKKTVKDPREERELIHFKKSISPDKIIDAVCRHYKIDKQNLLQKRSTLRIARKLAMYLCCQHCLGHTSLTDLGHLFNVSLSGLTRSRDRLDISRKNNKDICKEINEIEKSIAEV